MATALIEGGRELLHWWQAPVAGRPMRVDQRFVRCGVRWDDCVIDGDTLRYRGESWRIAGLDAPEVRDAACAEERRRGEAASERLVMFLSAAPFDLIPAGRGARDRYGRALAEVRRDRRDVTEAMVREGLARRNRWGEDPGWCPRKNSRTRLLRNLVGR